MVDDPIDFNGAESNVIVYCESRSGLSLERMARARQLLVIYYPKMSPNMTKFFEKSVKKGLVNLWNGTEIVKCEEPMQPIHNQASQHPSPNSRPAMPVESNDGPRMSQAIREDNTVHRSSSSNKIRNFFARIFKRK